MGQLEDCIYSFSVYGGRFSCCSHFVETVYNLAAQHSRTEMTAV